MTKQKTYLLFLYLMLQNCGKTDKADNITQISLELSFTDLKKQYPWLNKKIYTSVIKEATIQSVSKFLILAVVDAESYGNRHAKGPVVRVKVYGGRRITTRALGLMQIIPEFHYKRNSRRLFQVAVNIKVGVRVLKQALLTANQNLKVALKNYNSGPRSSYFNWKYINKIIANYQLSKNNNEKALALLY